jgi:vacuolar protein sorting-associated protein 13A/C
LVEFRWSSYDSNSFPNEEKIDSFIWVEIAPIEYEYYQQITIRMVDYLLIQIILLLTQPEMLTVNENLMEQLKKSENVEGEKPVKILFSQYEEIIKRLIHPFFMDMWFKLNDLNLILKAEKTSHIYYKVTMKELIFYNSTKRNAVRFDEESRRELKDFIYEDEYLVTGNDCHFIEVCEKKVKAE